MASWQVGWLKTLIAEYRREHDWESDADPTATEEMLAESAAVVAELELDHPACASCYVADATQGDVLCEDCRQSEANVIVYDTLPF